MEAGRSSHGCCRLVGISGQWSYLLLAHSYEHLWINVLTKMFPTVFPTVRKETKRKSNVTWAADTSAQHSAGPGTPHYHSFSPLVNRYVYEYMVCFRYTVGVKQVYGLFSEYHSVSLCIKCFILVFHFE